VTLEKEESLKKMQMPAKHLGQDKAVTWLNFDTPWL